MAFLLPCLDGLRHVHTVPGVERHKLKKSSGPAPGTTTILDRRIIKQFCKLIYRGLPADGACDYMGISPSSFWAWLRKGEKFITGGQGTAGADKIYGEFVMRFRRASARFRLRVIKRMDKTGGPQWVRDMTILERRDRKNFGRNEPMGGGDDDFDADDKFL